MDAIITQYSPLSYEMAFTRLQGSVASRKQRRIHKANDWNLIYMVHWDWTATPRAAISYLIGFVGELSASEQASRVSLL